ncbi:MAG: PilZ domain-containing protein [Anaeromyxobacteraceae bacterium]
MEFLENPRHNPRIPVRCDARIALPRGGFWGSPTYDLGSSGCQIVTAEPLPLGSELTLELKEDRVRSPVTVTGKVVWVSDRAPWHTGLAFTPASVDAAKPFFRAILEAYPGLGGFSYSPARIPLDAPLAPGPAPRVDPELAPEEADVLAALGEGMTTHALRAKLGARFPELSGPLFALVGRHQIVIGPPDRAAAAAWKESVARVVR